MAKLDKYYHLYSRKDDVIFEEIPKLDEIPGRNRGKWIETDEWDEWYGRIYKCSVCDRETMGTEDYCPNCGARMKE